MLTRVKKFLLVVFMLSLLSIAALLHWNKQSKHESGHNFFLTPSEESHTDDDAGIRPILEIKTISDSRSSEITKHLERDISQEMTVISIMCRDHRRHLRNLRGNMTRQMVQLATLIKSLFIFSQRPIHHIIITDHQYIYDGFIKYLYSTEQNGYRQYWPEEFKRKIRISRREAIYPNGTEHLKFNYIACTTVKLFLSHIVPDIDAAIVIDTDYLMFRSLDDLWNHFNHFDDKQMYGLVPSYTIYKSRRNRVSYYGEWGVNCGLIMVNFTRLVPVSQSFITEFMSLYAKYRRSVKYGDQDIFNPFFADHPELVYDISCDWNTRFHYCEKDGSYTCKEGMNGGVSAYHGAVGVFVSNTDSKVTAMFQAVRNVNLTREDLKRLPDTMLRDLRNVELQGLPYYCNNFSFYNEITTKRLFDFFLKY